MGHYFLDKQYYPAKVVCFKTYNTLTNGRDYLQAKAALAASILLTLPFIFELAWPTRVAW